MAIYVESWSAPTAGGGIKTFIDTESWDLVMTGVDDFHEPIAERRSLADVLREWLQDPDDVPYDGAELAQLVLQEIPPQKIPAVVWGLVREVLRTSAVRE